MTMQAGLSREPDNLNAIVADQFAFRSWYELALPRVYRYLLARSGGDPDLAERCCVDHVKAAAEAALSMIERSSAQKEKAVPDE